jgi:ribosomal-protein-alanine N-acetyltransferase
MRRGGDSMALADYIYNKPVIETERLILRPMTLSDVPALNEWMPDKSIYTYWGGRHK